MRCIRTVFLSILFASFSISTFATIISGKVTDATNNPLPFATVYVNGLGTGTATNTDGKYALALPAGNYELVFRYVGYVTRVEKVQVGEQDAVLNITLQEENLTLSEVVVSSKGKYNDPAFGIMRNAINKRKFYLNQVEAYSCRAYVKGLSRLLKAPKKILGQKVPTIPGLDSANRGIFYLSESVSDLHYRKPKIKEVMISSKVSGDPRGFSFNSAQAMRMNFYENLIKIDGLSERGFVSPVSANALFFYNYELLGTYKEAGVTVHKIAVIPKRREDPVFRGNIYIQDSTWRIHSTELLLTKAAKIDFLDTLRINQVYVPVTDTLWLMGTQRFTFDFRFLGFEATGYFLSSLSNYQVAPVFERKFFGNEILKVAPQANQRTEAYWDSIRPVPLTIEEQKDYTRKDSLSTVWESKPYLDSLDRESNQFKPINLITGYTYSNRFRSYSFTFSSLLNNVQFNTVEGLALETGVGFNKHYKKANRRFFSNNTLRYGFSGKQLYAKTETGYMFNLLKQGQIQLSGGRYVSQFNEQNPITPLINTAYTLFREENYLKLYEKSFAALNYQQEITNGVFITTTLEFAQRKPLQNTTDYTFRDREEKVYTPNEPFTLSERNPLFTEQNALVYTIGLRLNYKQQYISRPEFKINLDSPLPTLLVFYKKGIPDVFNSVTDFDLLQIRLTDEYQFGLFGESRFDALFGTFLNRDYVPLADHKHFAGNQTVIALNQLRSFYLLDYYAYSTTDTYWEGHYEHHFNGFLFNKIPYFRKLKLQEVVGVNFLSTPMLRQYTELSLGIENIFKVGRIDFVLSFGDAAFAQKTGFRFRIGL